MELSSAGGGSGSWFPDSEEVPVLSRCDAGRMETLLINSMEDCFFEEVAAIGVVAAGFEPVQPAANMAMNAMTIRFFKVLVVLDIGALSAKIRNTYHPGNKTNSS